MKVGSRMNYQPFSNASFAFRERLLMAECCLMTNGIRPSRHDPLLPVELLQSGHSRQDPARWKRPFVTSQ